jgi:hypothetical protein
MATDSSGGAYYSDDRDLAGGIFVIRARQIHVRE